MVDFQKYLSTAPILCAAYFTFLAGGLIELNRLYPDPLVFTIG
jgi:photosystem I subunit 9